jgi:hypothetical protein
MSKEIKIEYKLETIYQADENYIYTEKKNKYPVKYINGASFPPNRAYLDKPNFIKDKISKRVGEDKDRWQNITDLRGREATIKANGLVFFIDYVGDLKPEHTLKKPKNFYQKWSKSKNNWKTDTSKKQEILKLVKDKFNRETAEIIYNGIEYEGVQFNCDALAQQNFTGLLIKKDAIPYPYEVWEGDCFVSIKNSLEMDTICNKIFTFISVTRAVRRHKRDTLQDKTTEELIELL